MSDIYSVKITLELEGKGKVSIYRESQYALPTAEIDSLISGLIAKLTTREQVIKEE